MNSTVHTYTVDTSESEPLGFKHTTIPVGSNSISESRGSTVHRVTPLDVLYETCMLILWSKIHLVMLLIIQIVVFGTH